MSTDVSQSPVGFGFVELPDRFRSWHGTADELAEVGTTQFAKTDLPDARLNARLIRHYVSMGVLDPPTRRGREAHFGFRQLVQLAVVRKLLAQRLSLNNVRDLFRTIDWDQIDQIRDLLPRSAREGATDTPGVTAGMKNDKDTSALERWLESNRQRWAGDEKGEPRIAGAAQPLLRWTLAPGLELVAALGRIESLTDDDADALGLALASLLKRERDQSARRPACSLA